MNCWLFDLDGVLIRPGGYRAALKMTTDYFSRLFGLGESTLSDSDIDVFESFGITSEWDSSAICAAALLYRIWQMESSLPPAPNTDETTDFPRAGSPSSPPVNFGTVARQVGIHTSEGGYPSDAALEFFLGAAREEQPSHPSRTDLEGWLRLFLEHTRDFSRSPTIRVFQAYALGERDYRATYRIEPPVSSPSLLMELDQPNISGNGLRIIQEGIATGLLCAAVFTSRPTRPLTLPGSRIDNSPEAEISLRALNLSLPLAGYGQMLWLSDVRGNRTDAYLKPSPVHALAAICLAAGVEESAALESARAAVEEGIIPPEMDFLRNGQTRIHLFEDTPTGIRSLQQAARILAKQGISVDVTLIGITDSPDKTAALQALGAEVFADADRALAHARSQLAPQ
jgi:hypothetical protein